ncbi:FAD-dependent oxidoreductase [Streptomyces sp. NPDC001667]
MTANGDIMIIGAGVTGLTTGLALLESGHPVHVIAAEIPGPTSVAAAALWGPYLVGPWSKVRRWSADSFQVFRSLSRDPTSGVRMVTGIEAVRHPTPAPEWGSLLPEFRSCSREELPPGFIEGYRFTAPLIDMPTYLDYLLRRYGEAGGTIEQREINSLDELDQTITVVNCAGLGAGRLVGDHTVRPVHGQHVIVENPGITEFFIEDTGLSSDLVCFFPQGETVVLGGTAIDGDPSLEADPAAAAEIVKRCAAIDPRLEKARVLEHRVGARPTRPEVRVEAGQRGGGALMFHNYGHGGAGVTVSWGCAQEITVMISQHS